MNRKRKDDWFSGEDWNIDDIFNNLDGEFQKMRKQMDSLMRDALENNNLDKEELDEPCNNIFIVNPNAYMPKAATKNETGIPKAVIKATREFKNKYKERSNKNNPIKPEDLTVSNLVLTFFEKSLKTDT